MTQPNIVLICADQWRGDCLSGAGHPVVKTPYLDRLAATGARFTNAYSASPTCIPARMSLMTGLTAASHGRVGYADGVPFDVAPTMPGEFSRAGFQSQAIGKMHNSPERGRIGFDDIILHDGYLIHERDRRRPVEFYDDYLPWLRQQAGESAVSEYCDDGLHCDSMIARPWNRAEALHPTNWVVSQATQWLYRRDPTVPFLLYLSFTRPHPPFNPPAWAFEQYLDAPDHRPPIGDWTEDFGPLAQDDSPVAHFVRSSQVDLNRARAGYFGNISHIDHQIERFLAVLREFRLAKDTYICFTSDHGEMLGDHNLWRKSYPYEGSSRIPLILAGPGIDPGLVVEELVELRDIMPTLLSLAGLQVPDSCEGASLLQFVHQAHRTAANSKGPWRTYLHGEHSMGERMSTQWIRTGDWKYVWFSETGHEQLFDVVRDPHECVNLAAADQTANVLARCRAALVTELTARPEEFVADGTLRAGRSTVAVLPGAGGRPRGLGELAIPESPS